MAGVRRVLPRFIALILLLMPVSPARAEEPVRIGLGFGLAFLPIYICEDLKLVEKYGREAKLELRSDHTLNGAKALRASVGISCCG